MSRPLAYTVSVGILAAVISPALHANPGDSYPLSTYPMFSQRRTAPVLYFAEGVDGRGARSRLPPEFVANDEVMQAAAAVRRAVNDGAEARARLCAHIAERARASSSHAGVVRVELVGARFDPVAYFVNGGEPLERHVHFVCNAEAR